MSDPRTYFAIDLKSFYASVAWGHRSANRQPGFGLMGEVTSPLMTIRWRFTWMDGMGIADSRPLV